MRLPVAVAVLMSLVAGASAQAQESRVAWPRGFRAPSSRAQLAQCHFTALTRRLALDSQQVTVVRLAIAQSIDTTTPRPRNRLEWEARSRVRDSVIMSVLRNRSDSLRFTENGRTEMNWFYSGACNG